MLSGVTLRPNKIDSHQHYWDPERAHYPWLTAALEPIRRAFEPADLAPHLAATGIARTILVQTRADIAETREFLALAERTVSIAGVVGWADLTSETLGADIAALRAGPGGSALVGIRHQVHDEADAAWLVRADVRRGLATIEAADLAFDLLVRERELPAAVAVVREFTNLRFVLDHIAKPRIAGATVPAGWLDGIAQLGGCPNVWCKISGLVTEAGRTGWSIDRLQVYVAHIVAAFRADRLMFGSDWPVCLLAATYEEVVDVAQTLMHAFLDAPQVEAFFGRTAADAYRLDDA